MAELTVDQKTELVSRIARFESYADVASEMSEKHQIQLDRVQVRDYDPTKAGYAAGEKWRPIFASVRDEYLADLSAIPVTSQAYRLSILQRGIDAALLKEDWRLAACLAEQAAKDLGGVFTKFREIAIRPPERERVRDLSPEDRRTMLTDLVRKALEQRKATTGEHLLKQRSEGADNQVVPQFEN